MIVSKKTKVTAAEEVIEQELENVVPDEGSAVEEPAVEEPAVEAPAVEAPAVEDIPCIDPKACALEHIMEAIKSLTKIAKTDSVAKDSIANLAVVMFDLQ